MSNNQPKKLGSVKISLGVSRSKSQELVRNVQVFDRPMPGLRLEELLTRFKYIVPANCSSCKNLADRMNTLGISWCSSEEGLEEISTHMLNVAKLNKIPFAKKTALKLIRLAIKSSEVLYRDHLELLNEHQQKFVKAGEPTDLLPQNSELPEQNELLL